VGRVDSMIPRVVLADMVGTAEEELVTTMTFFLVVCSSFSHSSSEEHSFSHSSSEEHSEPLSESESEQYSSESESESCPFPLSSRLLSPATTESCSAKS